MKLCNALVHNKLCQSQWNFAQCNCRDLGKILFWLVEHISNQNTQNVYWILQSIPFPGVRTCITPNCLEGTLLSQTICQKHKITQAETTEIFGSHKNNSSITKLFVMAAKDILHAYERQLKGCLQIFVGCGGQKMGPVNNISNSGGRMRRYILTTRAV